MQDVFRTFYSTVINGVMPQRDRELDFSVWRVTVILAIIYHSVCPDLGDLGGVIDSYRTLAKSHLNVAVM